MTKRIHLYPPLILAAVVALAGVVTGLVTGLVATAAGAASPPSALREGSGYRLADGDFVGDYVTHAGGKVYCLSPRKALPVSVSMATVSRVPGVSNLAT